MKEIKDNTKRWRGIPCMLLGWKNQHCENDSTTQSNLHVQCNPYQIPMAFFTAVEQKNPQFVCKHKRPRIGKEIGRASCRERV